MTIFQFMVTYAVCWWLVLFMVLPHEAAAPEKPGRGHAPSAPANPQLKRKCRWATFYAIIPAIGIYFIATYAKADEIYHVGGGCAPLEAYHSSGDVSTRDGYGAKGKQVKSANVEGASSIVGTMNHIAIPLEIPTAKYLDAANGPANHNVDLSQSFANIGTIEINKDSPALLNGQPIGGQAVLPSGCDHPAK